MGPTERLHTVVGTRAELALAPRDALYQPHVSRRRGAGVGAGQSGQRSLRARRGTHGPLSNRLAKALSVAALDRPLDEALSLSTTAQQQIFDSHDLHEGAAAFFAKRQPVFKGR